MIGDRGYHSDALDAQLQEDYGIDMIPRHRRARRVATQDGRVARRTGRRWKIERLFAWLQLPPPRHATSLRALVQLAHQRWAIEQEYQEVKDELGLDHFEGRSLPGWERHVALTALAYTF